MLWQILIYTFWFCIYVYLTNIFIQSGCDTQIIISFAKKEKKGFLQAVLHHLLKHVYTMNDSVFVIHVIIVGIWRITFHVHVLFLMNYINWFMYISIFTKSINLNVYQLFKTNPSYKILIWIQYKVWSCCNKWFNFKCEIYYKHVVFVLAM